MPLFSALNAAIKDRDAEKLLQGCIQDIRKTNREYHPKAADTGAEGDSAKSKPDKDTLWHSLAFEISAAQKVISLNKTRKDAAKKSLGKQRTGYMYMYTYMYMCM